MSRADNLAISDKAVQSFVLDGEITDAEVAAGVAQGRKWFSLRRLRLGFEASLTQNGYLVFPVWLGSLIIQWGVSAAGNSSDIAFPLAFTSSVFAVVTGDLNDSNQTGETNALSALGGGNGTTPTVSGMTIQKYLAASSGAQRVYWVAIGK